MRNNHEADYYANALIRGQVSPHALRAVTGYDLCCRMPERWSERRDASY